MQSHALKPFHQQFPYYLFLACLPRQREKGSPHLAHGLDDDRPVALIRQQAQRMRHIDTGRLRRTNADLRGKSGHKSRVSPRLSRFPLAPRTLRSLDAADRTMLGYQIPSTSDYLWSRLPAARTSLPHRFPKFTSSAHLILRNGALITGLVHPTVVLKLAVLWPHGCCAGDFLAGNGVVGESAVEPRKGYCVCSKAVYAWQRCKDSVGCRNA